MIQEVQASPPLKIILSSDTTDVFSDVMIGINCNDSIGFDEIGGKEEILTTNLSDFKIEMAILPTLLATCPENENCVDLDVSVFSPPPLPLPLSHQEPEWWEKIEVVVGIIGTIIASIVGVITISEKLKRNKSRK